jgi:hypothetical protein
MMDYCLGVCVLTAILFCAGLETATYCTFKWSDGRTVETIGAPPIIQH